MLNIILFGPPGSGKGTQAEKMIEKYGILHISTGDLFRYEMGNNTPLGLKAKEYMAKGELVPDEVTIGMLENKVNANPDAQGIIFDGFPRTIPQAEALDVFLKEKNTEVTLLLALDVPEEELTKRLLKRGESSGRADDRDESIIKNRIQVYKSETSQVFDYYNQVGKSVSIHGVGTIDEIFESISEAIDQACC
ncbi:MAG: adenylate kinase [Chitinophagales bacterium]|nr:adenylate kinase [Chitinophagales bacterium]